MIFCPIFVIYLLPLAARAAVTSNEPCHNGQCQWDISTDSGSGSLQIVGSQSSISDLTDAAGWTVLDCDDSSGQMDIRLACHDRGLCDHLYLNAPKTRLLSCPTTADRIPLHSSFMNGITKISAFPRLRGRRLCGATAPYPPSRAWESLASKPQRPEVSQHGAVSFFLQASSIPGLGNRLLISPDAGDRSVSRKRWLSDSALALREVHANFQTGEWDVDHSEGPNKFVGDTNGTKELFSYSLPCPIFESEHTSTSGGADLSIAGRMNGTISYGLVAAGVFGVHDPNVTEFSLFVDLDADIQGVLDVGVNLTGTLTSPDLTLFEIGIPSLDYPKILSIGPTFSVIARADATLEADMDFQASIAYKISNAHLIFPDDDMQSNGTFKPGDSDLQLSVSPGTTTSAKLAVHLVPTISFGINLEVVDTEATVSIGLDAQAALDLSLSASASASTDTGSSAVQPELGGCANVTTGLSISAGADAGLFKLFDAGVTYQLWGDEWQLWGNCWDMPKKRDDVSGNVTSTGDWYADRGLGHRVPLSMFEENLRKDHRKHATSNANANSTLASASGSADQDSQNGAAESKQKGDTNASGSKDDDSTAFSLACPNLKPGAVQPLIEPQTVSGSSLQTLKH